MTRALFTNLKALGTDAMLFGHQEDLAYGVNWRGEPGRSDVREVTGSYPAVYGWDVTWFMNPREPGKENPNGAAYVRNFIMEAYRRGGVSTLCWHMPNPVTNTNAWDTTRAVNAVIPGGTLHDKYRAMLDEVAAFALSLRDDSTGEPVPVIFRPFHEHTGSWFWWGRNHATVAEFVELWRFTVEYLRDVKGVHNLLYAYSTDVFDTEEAYLERYPGDAYIDVLGFDDYHSIKTVGTRDVLVRRLQMLGDMAAHRGKIAAITETGVEAIPDSTWWTQVLLPALKTDARTRSIAYVVVWRNANKETDRPNHFYASYPGHPSAPDFVRFYKDPFILFEDELPNLYR